MIDRNPAVTKLDVHLEGEPYVLFPSNATQAQRLEITNRTHSPLMEYFARPIGVYNMRFEMVPVVSEPLPDTFSEIPNYTIKSVSNSCSTCPKIVTTTTSAYIRVSMSNSSMVQACNPFLITHTTTMSLKCHHHTHIWANPNSQLHRPTTAKRYTFTSTKPPYLFLLLPKTDDVHLGYTAMARHYDTFHLIIPDPFEQPHAPISGGGLSSAS